MGDMLKVGGVEMPKENAELYVAVLKLWDRAYRAGKEGMPCPLMTEKYYEVFEEPIPNDLAVFMENVDAASLREYERGKHERE